MNQDLSVKWSAPSRRRSRAAAGAAFVVALLSVSLARSPLARATVPVQDSGEPDSKAGSSLVNTMTQDDPEISGVLSAMRALSADQRSLAFVWPQSELLPPELEELRLASTVGEAVDILLNVLSEHPSVNIPVGFWSAIGAGLVAIGSTIGAAPACAFGGPAGCAGAVFIAVGAWFIAVEEIRDYQNDCSRVPPPSSCTPK